MALLLVKSQSTSRWLLRQVSARMRSIQWLPCATLVACAHAATSPSSAKIQPPAAAARTRLQLVPVPALHAPPAYTRLSADGRFAYYDGLLFDRGDCSPRARISGLAMRQLEEAPSSLWKPAERSVNAATFQARVRAHEDDRTSCEANWFDTVALKLNVVCLRQGPEEQATESWWEDIGGSKLAQLCVEHEDQSLTRTSYGDDVRWSKGHDAFTFLELNEGWNFHSRIIHVVDLTAGTHEKIDDDEVAMRGAPPSYDAIKRVDEASATRSVANGEVGKRALTLSFDPDSQTVFVTRADGQRLRLFDDHLWPSDGGAESPWSDVTSRTRFRTSVDPLGGKLLEYNAIEQSFIVPGLFHRFLGGAPMPSRPAPEVDAPPRLTVKTRKGGVHAVAEDVGGGLANIVVHRSGDFDENREVVAQGSRGRGQTIEIDVVTKTRVNISACTATHGGICSFARGVRPEESEQPSDK